MLNRFCFITLLVIVRVILLNKKTVNKSYGQIIINHNRFPPLELTRQVQRVNTFAPSMGKVLSQHKAPLADNIQLMIFASESTASTIIIAPIFSNVNDFGSPFFVCNTPYHAL
jgi:hypothetical protein